MGIERDEVLRGTKAIDLKDDDIISITRPSDQRSTPFRVISFRDFVQQVSNRLGLGVDALVPRKVNNKINLKVG